MRSDLSAVQAAKKLAEEEFFQQIARAKGIKLPAAKPVEEKTVAPAPPDLAEYADRLQERVEADVLTQQQADFLLDEARNGTQTKEELDRSLWMSRSEGSTEF